MRPDKLSVAVAENAICAHRSGGTVSDGGAPTGRDMAGQPGDWRGDMSGRSDGRFNTGGRQEREAPAMRPGTHPTPPTAPPFTLGPALDASGALMPRVTRSDPGP